MSKKPISVILVDDHPIVMEGLRSLLESNHRVRIRGSFTNGSSALAYLKKNRVDLVLLDISLPDMNGIDLCRQIKLLDASICVLAISNHSERSIIMQMLQYGASGYLLKNSSSKELSNSIISALDGNLVLSPEVKQIIAQGETSQSNRPSLTRREKEVLRLVADGMTTAAIAEKLFISPLTVETHRRNLMQKFEVNNTAALIKLAFEQKLI